jgi:dTDP-4-amino-4,6-dideoxygalactose transaminase
MGNAGCISFFPSKNLGAFGDGGMVVTGNADIADKIRTLRVHGSKVRYIHSVIGTNARLDNLQAAILRVKLRYLDKWAEMRQRNAVIYNQHLSVEGVFTPFVPEYNTHVYHQYVIKVPQSKRDALIERLVASGVESRVYYPIPLHLQECYKSLGYKAGDLPISEEAAKATLALPVYPELLKEDVVKISDMIIKFLK